ncbi:peptidoglycan glycosyltransferase [Caballeronia calidae]|uniref:Peptidoglycan glycosyltransferase n=1 Tax=Caballeronia calidae TaxID=1777139 RepID=A0A158CJB1_9BURK|nr:peptidoglycan glycosyltransferase [Caballeronia calidae]
MGITASRHRTGARCRPALILSADGDVITEFKPLNREWVVTLNQMSPHVVDALIATEDHRFYKHHGIDFQRVAAAAHQPLTRSCFGNPAASRVKSFLSGSYLASPSTRLPLIIAYRTCDSR